MIGRIGLIVLGIGLIELRIGLIELGKGLKELGIGLRINNARHTILARISSLVLQNPANNNFYTFFRSGKALGCTGLRKEIHSNIWL